MPTSKDEESSREETKTTSSWGTWEELLLTCAVKRHGLKNWESVATELQTKTSLPHRLTTAQCCKQKYIDLKRRFNDSNNNNSSIPWLDQLKKVRVDELKQDLRRYDLSINCLQQKVKRLEEERETETKSNNKTDSVTGTDPEPDLNTISQNDKNKSDQEETDRSVNESNSTGVRRRDGDGGGEVVKSEAEAVVGSGFDTGGEFGGERGVTELGDDSVSQLSSGDVQSSASYGRKKRKIGSGTDAKSEPLIRVLDVIRSHKHASLFQRRKIQESSKYKEIVRQHVDLETIEARVEQGLYSSTSHFNFYRDLLILFNNAIVYFSKSSLESSTAHELARLVSLQIPTKPPPLQRSDSLLDKQKSTAPIIVCRKRSSVSGKPSSAFVQKPDNVVDQKMSSKLKVEEKPVILTGTRSSRRNVNQSTGDSTKKISSAEKKKSVVDFLKRIKKNSSPEGKKNSSENKKGKKEKQNSSPAKKNVGRPAKKTTTTTTTDTTTPVTGKRGKEAVVTTKRQSKRPRR